MKTLRELGYKCPVGFQSYRSKVRALYRGEFGWPGGLVIKVQSGFVIAAFSGGPSEDDVKCSRAAVAILSKRL